MQHQQLYTVKDLAQYLKVSVSHIWAEVRANKFPQPFKLSANKTRWTNTQIDAFVAVKIEASKLVH